MHFENFRLFNSAGTFFSEQLLTMAEDHPGTLDLYHPDALESQITEARNTRRC